MAQTLTLLIADFSTTLVSKTAVGATSLTLASATDSDGIAIPTGTYAFTIDRKNSSKEHFTATLTGTALTNVKTIARGTGTATSGLLRTHRKGAEIIMSDFVTLKRIINVLNGTTDLDASTPLKYDGVATLTPGSNQLATVEYAESLSNQGAATASTSTKGIIKVSTAAVDSNNPIAVGDNDTRVPTINMSTFSSGYLAALAGTSGTPASTNKYVTNDDTSYGTDQSQTTRDGTVTTGEADTTTKHNLLAQSFVAGRTSQIGAVLHKLADTGTFTGTVKVALQADSTGSPSGSDLASVTLSNATWLALNAGLVNFIYGTPYTATVGTTYWIVVTCSTSDNSNHPNFGTSTAGGYSSGSVKFKNTTDGWTAIATIDLTFATLTTQASKIIRGDSTGRVFGQVWYGADAGSTDAYAITVPNFPGTLQTGDQFTVLVATANTGACTLNINGTGAKAIKKRGNIDLETGDILSSQILNLVYDGTNMQMQSQQANAYAFFSQGQITRASATGTGTQNIAHGLGRTPRMVVMNYTGTFTSSNAAATVGTGTCSTTSDMTCSYYTDDNIDQGGLGQEAHIIVVRSGSGTAGFIADVSALDATNITLNFTTNTGGGNVYIQWQAFA